LNRIAAQSRQRFEFVLLNGYASKASGVKFQKKPLVKNFTTGQFAALFSAAVPLRDHIFVMAALRMLCLKRHAPFQNIIEFAAVARPSGFELGGRWAR
jgi:hypothetical protein